MPLSWNQTTQDEVCFSERPSEALPTPSPAPTSEAPLEPQTDSSPAQTSEVPFEHQPNPSPRPSPTNTIPASTPETSGEKPWRSFNASDKSFQGMSGDMTKPSVLYSQEREHLKEHRVHKEYVSKQGRKFAKGESSVQRDPLFDEMPEDKIDHMETENAQSEGRTREMGNEDKDIDERMLSTEDVLSTDKEGVSTDFEKVSTDRPIVSTDGSKVSTDRQIEGTEDQVKGTDEHNEGTEDKNEGTEEIFEGTEELREGTEEKVESTDGQVKGTEDQTEEEIATQTSTQTPTSMIFGDDETIAKVLLNMSKVKVVSKEKEKGVELKDVEETDRPRPTSTRSLLTLKPLPKIDPKDKGKKKIEEEDESESESDGISQAEKKFKQLESDEELARKVRIKADRLLAEKLQEQEREQFTIEERAKFLHTQMLAQKKILLCLTKNQEDLNAVYQLVMDKYQYEMSEGFDRVLWGDLMVLFNSDDKDEFWSSQQDWKIVSWKLHSSSGIHTLVTDTGLIIHMLVEKKYPLKKEVLKQMLKLKLESEEENTMALEFLQS
ncbi:hypothetical protein Tco_0533245 [Tanacetum coccineum]